MGLRASKLSKMCLPNGVFKRLEDSPNKAPPRGYVPVSVGVIESETRRFMVHTSSLGEDEFVELLRRSAEEYGFRNQGVLRIPYDPKEFEDWVIRGGRGNRRILFVTPA